MNSIVVGGHLLDFREPRIMAVINVTPDSFYSNSRIQNVEAFVQRVNQCLIEGADIIDIGAFSSRPGAELISSEEEYSRLKPFIDELNISFPDILISIDTYRSEVIAQLVNTRSFIVNDITGFDQDPRILKIVAENKLPYVLMHMKGLPKDMQNNPSYVNPTEEILNYFAEKLQILKHNGIEQIILDPGFGFGKRLNDNYQLLSQLTAFQIFGKPVLAGLSRKSMIYKLLDSDAANALNGTTALHMVALQNGARILRVHDVKEAKECIKLWKALNKPVNN